MNSNNEDEQIKKMLASAAEWEADLGKLAKNSAIPRERSKATRELSAAHTPTPWRTGGVGDEFVISTVEHEPSVARATGITHEEAATNAEFIVKACNAHDALVAALMKFGSHLHGCDIHNPPRRTKINKCDCGYRAALLLANGPDTSATGDRSRTKE